MNKWSQILEINPGINPEEYQLNTHDYEVIDSTNPYPYYCTVDESHMIKNSQQQDICLPSPGEDTWSDNASLQLPASPNLLELCCLEMEKKGLRFFGRYPNEAITVDNRTIMLPESTIQSCESTTNKGCISRCLPTPYRHSAKRKDQGLTIATTAEIHTDFIRGDEVHTYENMDCQGNDSLQAANASSDSSVDNHVTISDNGQAGGTTVPSVHAEPSPIQFYEDALNVYEVYTL